MTERFEDLLRARLERLAGAVPVGGAGEPGGVVGSAPRYRGGMPGGGALVAAALVVVVLLAVVAVGGGAPRGEVTAATTDGLFRLTLRTPHGRYAVDEAIAVLATLEYVGGEPSIEVYSHPGMPGFGVEQLDGSHRADPAYRSSCEPYEFRRGQPVAFPFVKSGGFAPDDPDAEFLRRYLGVTDGRPDPVLRLPPGTWRVFAVADFAEGGCGGIAHRLEAGVTVAVGSPGPASASPPGSTAAASPPGASASTAPPAGPVQANPDGCAAYGLSERRCSYIVAWAKRQAGLAPGERPAVELLGDPECPPDGPTPCAVARLGFRFVVRVRLTTSSGASSDHPLLCGLGGESSLLCTEQPRIRLGTPINGYHDVPCSGPAPGSPCATPLPAIDPAAAAAARPLEVATLDIPIDHVGAYSIQVGEATLPNGILTEATFGLADDSPSDVLVTPDGMRLTITSLDGGPPFDNAYRRGWHAGTERVRAWLTFSVEWFEPGAVLRVTGLRIG